MAVTIDNLIQALRLGDTPEERTNAVRLMKVAKAIVDREAPNAPVVIKDEACIRLCGYLYDMPNAARGASFANAFRNSGAQALLSPYRALKVRVTP